MTKKIIIIAGPNGADTWAEYDNVGEEPTLLQWGENR